MSRGNEQPPRNDNPLNDIYGDHRQIDQKPGKIATAIGKLALVGAAIGVVGAGARARQAENPAQPINDAVKVGRQIADLVIPSEKKPEPQNSAPAPQGEIASTLPAEKTDVTELNEIYNTFVADLKKIPGAIMMGMKAQKLEGVKVAVGEDTYKFIWPKEQTGEKTLIVENNHLVTTFVIKGGEVTKEVFVKDTGIQEEKPSEQSSPNLVLDITEQLQKAYKEWSAMRPTPTPTPINPFKTPGPYDRTVHETKNLQPVEQKAG